MASSLQAQRDEQILYQRVAKGGPAQDLGQRDRNSKRTDFWFFLGATIENNLTEWQDDVKDKVGAENCCKRCGFIVDVLSTKNKETSWGIY